MLLALDGALGDVATAAVPALRQALDGAVQPFVAPTTPPDAGLLAVLAAGPLATVLAPEPTPWLASLPARVVAIPPAGDLVAAVAAALDLPLERQPVRAPRLAPLDAAALAEGLVALGDRWRPEIGQGDGLGGLVVELVASFHLPTYLAAARFAHEVAALAEVQDHHPTLVHAYRTVTVRVTTGEAGRRLGERDLAFAAAVNGLAAGLSAAGG